MTTSSLFPILISVVAIYAAGGVADGFSFIRFATTRNTSFFIHNSRQLSNPDVRFHLFSTTSSNNNNNNDDAINSQVDKKLSKNEQEDLWLSNALYFDQKKKSKGSTSGKHPNNELELSLPLPLPSQAHYLQHVASIEFWKKIEKESRTAMDAQCGNTRIAIPSSARR